MKIDHIILAVDDLDRAAAELTAATGLATTPGGRHPDWGTANVIVPLGEGYLELVAVVDPGVAAATPFGRAVAGNAGALAGWAVSTGDLDATAQRLGVATVAGRRTRPDGTTLSWSMAGVDEALTRGLPFFLRWDDPAGNPARTPAAHRTAPTGIAWLEHTGDAAALAGWLGPDGTALPLRPAPSGTARAGIALADGSEVVVPLGN
jgi:hypothetical protein